MPFNYLPPGVDLWTVIAGLCGGIVSALKRWNEPAEAIRILLTGLFCAMFLGGLVKPLIAFALQPFGLGDMAGYSAGFIVGLTGVLFVEFIAHIVREYLHSKMGGEDETGD